MLPQKIICVIGGERCGTSLTTKILIDQIKSNEISLSANQEGWDKLIRTNIFNDFYESIEKKAREERSTLENIKNHPNEFCFHTDSTIDMKTLAASLTSAAFLKMFFDDDPKENIIFKTLYGPAKGHEVVLKTLSILKELGVKIHVVYLYREKKQDKTVKSDMLSAMKENDCFIEYKELSTKSKIESILQKIFGDEYSYKREEHTNSLNIRCSHGGNVKDVKGG